MVWKIGQKNTIVMSTVQFTNTIFPTNTRATISHFKIIDQDSKQVTRKATETIHMGLNDPDLKQNTGKTYIPEIFNNLHDADRSSNDFKQVVDLDLPQGHTHLTIPSNRFSRVVCLAL